MPIDKSIVGQASAPQDFIVERGAIRRFAEAIGDTNPLFVDAAYTQSRGFADVIAPPTFPTTFRLALPVTIDLSHVLHGKQEYTYQRPIVAGETLRCTNTITQVYERDGSLGTMTFVVVEVSGTDPQGAPVFTGTSTIIIHEGK